MTRIHARDTTVVKLSETEAQEFINQYHRQGALKSLSARRSVGLVYRGTLVGVAQFGTPRTPEKRETYTTELLRMCFRDDVRIPGGASKLVRGYISMYNPRDMFTYQDTNGEQTTVYEHCGFTLVKQYSTKSLLVAPGKTLETADRKRGEIYTVRVAATLGPDILLGTSLGERFHDDGTRLTNVQLFTDILGWTRVDVSGDKVYEWINQNYTYYTYKITATDSDKYYYGVSSVNIPHATREQCHNHPYYGSGGNKNPTTNKFVNWKKKHENTLVKEVLGIFKNRSESYRAEKELVGDLWTTDPLCLNSCPGGGYTGSNPGWTGMVVMKECPVHGLVKHRGNACCSCTAQQSIAQRECPVHGMTTHQGDTCNKCAIQSVFTVQHCDIHGDTIFVGETCGKCRNLSTIEELACPTHGLVKHRAGKCCSCNAESSVHTDICPTHGETKFVGSHCRKCMSRKQDTKKICVLHGESVHRGNSCMKCTSFKGAHKRGKHDKIFNIHCPLCRESQSLNQTQEVEDKEHHNGTQKDY